MAKDPTTANDAEDVPSHRPDGLVRKYIAHSKNKILIPNITVGQGAFLAPRWDAENTADVWEVTGSDLKPDPGFTFGSIFYTNRVDQRQVRVGCLYDKHEAVYRCVALHPTEAREDDTLTDNEREIVLLDARSRLGHLHSLLLQIATNVMTDPSNLALLEAAGFGTDITIYHEDDNEAEGE